MVEGKTMSAYLWLESIEQKNQIIELRDKPAQTATGIWVCECVECVHCQAWGNR